jgi:hypothetical protein
MLPDALGCFSPASGLNVTKSPIRRQVMWEPIDDRAPVCRTPCRLTQPCSIVTREIRIDKYELWTDRLHVHPDSADTHIPSRFAKFLFSPVVGSI